MSYRLQVKSPSSVSISGKTVKVNTGDFVNLSDTDGQRLMNGPFGYKFTVISITPGQDTGLGVEPLDLRNRQYHTGTQSVDTITGLGNSAVRNVGSAPGTVAAGDDPRFDDIGGGVGNDPSFNSVTTTQGFFLTNGASVASGSFIGGGQGGVSLYCDVGYELNYQANRLRALVAGDETGAPIPLWVDSQLLLPAEGVKFSDNTVQTTAAVKSDWDAAPGDAAEILNKPTITGTNLSIANQGGTTLDIVSSNGDDVVLPAATNTTAGLATAAQITKLESIEAGSGAAASNLFFTAARAIGAALTGFTSAVGAVTAADSLLQAVQKLWGNSNISTTLVLTGDATTINAGAGSGRKYRLTTTTTAGITIDIANLPTGSGEWEAELLLTTTAVPASITWTGATVVFMTGLTFMAYPLVAGRLTRIGLSKQVAGRVTAMVWPAEEIS